MKSTPGKIDKSDLALSLLHRVAPREAELTDLAAEFPER